ncbi:UDP-N-acetylmuramate dehydrogenase [Treponema sp.]|uniref:UDP-N-acetylmuramate dehydrogenase n=1 Tax=Treponema sp. TaxID=166 RepID=UPI00388F28AA
MLKLHEFIENINKTQYKGKILEHEPMAPRTTMKVGGTAALLLSPSDENSICIAVSLLKDMELPWFILGGGSNVIAPDGELDAVVISTEELDSIEISEKNDEFTLIQCGAGTKTGTLVDFCTENGISGLETFAGLPGTVGGAAFMNARCYGKEVSQVLHSARFLEFDPMQKNTEFHDNFIERHLKMYHNTQMGGDWAYKNSPFMQNHRFITSLTFKAGRIDSDNKVRIGLECEGYIKDREDKGHFKAPSAGSVFKNDRSFGEPSGVLIDKAGLKGTEVGGAQVAPWHGNIIINRGGASSSDIKTLVKTVQERVKNNTGFMLEPEIIFAEQNLC